MDQIVKSFIEVVLSVVVISFFLVLVFHFHFEEDKTGLFSYLGEKVTFYTKEEEWKTAYQTFQQEAAKKLPYIDYDANKSNMKTGETYMLSEYLKAYDYKDQTLSFEVLRIYDTQHKEAMSTLSEDKQTVTFMKSGIYELDLRVKDMTNRSKTYHFRIPVERGGI